jgi:hypothetical protein
VLAHGIASTNAGAVGSVFAATRLGPNAELFVGGTSRSQSSYRDGNGNIVPNTGYDVWTGAVGTKGSITMRLAGGDAPSKVALMTK